MSAAAESTCLVGWSRFDAITIMNNPQLRFVPHCGGLKMVDQQNETTE